MSIPRRVMGSQPGLEFGRGVEAALGVGLWVVGLVGVLRVVGPSPSDAAVVTMAVLGGVLAMAGIANRREGRPLSPMHYLVVDRAVLALLLLCGPVFALRGEPVASLALLAAGVCLGLMTLVVRYQ